MWPPSRRSASNVDCCPNESIGERPGTPGATSRSNCPSRWTRAAPCSSTSIPATTPRPRSAPGARRTAGSGTRSRDKAGPSRSSLSRAPRGSSSEPDAGIREELARIERAILQGAVQILEEFGGLQAAMKRSVVLEKQVRRQPGPGSIRRASTWRTVRLAGPRPLGVAPKPSVPGGKAVEPPISAVADRTPAAGAPSAYVIRGGTRRRAGAQLSLVPARQGSSSYLLHLVEYELAASIVGGMPGGLRPRTSWKGRPLPAGLPWVAWKLGCGFGARTLGQWRAQVNSRFRPRDPSAAVSR